MTLKTTLLRRMRRMKNRIHRKRNKRSQSSCKSRQRNGVVAPVLQVSSHCCVMKLIRMLSVQEEVDAVLQEPLDLGQVQPAGHCPVPHVPLHHV
jgi:hypothetical protein